MIEKYAVVNLEYLLQSEPPASLCAPERGRTEVATTWTEDLIKSCLYLYLAVLCCNEQLVHR